MHRVTQFFGHLTARVGPGDEEVARRLLPPAVWPLFTGMPVADRRHGLDVAGRLLAAGWDDPDLLAAALLHDVGKGHRLRLWHRVAGVLMERTVPRLLARLATADSRSWRFPFHVYLRHADRSAEAVLSAGGSPRTAALIRGSAELADAPLARALHDADEAS